MKNKKVISPEMTALLVRSGHANYENAYAAQIELAIALTNPLKQGVLKGDILGDVFEELFFPPGISVEYPTDLLSPGSESEYIAYTSPNTGRIPERHVEGDYLMVPTYDTSTSIDYSLKYARDARWDVVARVQQIMEAMFVRKRNNDGFHVLMAAGAGRNLAAYDNAATSGLFTKRLVALGKTLMRRSAGGNSTSINKGKLTDLYISPESLEDVRSWDLTQISDAIRTQIFLSGGDDESALTEIFKVKLHDIDELGVGQEYQNYYSNVLSGTLPSDKVEIVVGLDLFNRDSFVHPVRQNMEMFPDPTFHRARRAGYYGTEEGGWGALDARRALILAI